MFPRRNQPAKPKRGQWDWAERKTQMNIYRYQVRAVSASGEIKTDRGNMAVSPGENLEQRLGEKADEYKGFFFDGPHSVTVSTEGVSVTREFGGE